MGLLFSLFVFLIGGNGKTDVNAPYPLIYKAVLFIPQEISLSFLFGRRKKDVLSSQYIYTHTYIYKCVCLKKIHPVFEKLEFYLNLKNDFALTFLQDKHRVYFFSEKIPKMLTKREMWKYLVTPDVTSLTAREREREYKSSSVFFLFLLFVFLFCVKCTKILGRFFLVSCSVVSGFF